MKHLKLLLIALLTCFSIAQAQTAQFVTKKCSVVVDGKTVATWTDSTLVPVITLPPVHDTIPRVCAPCPACPDTTKPPIVTAPFQYVLYVGGEFATIFLDATKSLELKKYLKDYGYNGVSYYGLGSISESNWPKLRAFNKDLRNNYGIIYIEATASSSSTFANERTRFNAGCTDPKEKFNGFNMEKEFWNADPNGDGVHSDAEVLAAWKLDSVEWTKSKVAADAAGVEFTWYLGWPLKTYPPVHQVKNSTTAWFHIYRSFPDTTYGEERWINENTAQKIADPTKKLGVVLGFSAETAFMRTWLKTHTIQQIRAMVEPAINRHSNLYLAKIQIFMYSEIKQAQLPKTGTLTAPAAAARLAIPEVPSATPEHMETAKERY